MLQDLGLSECNLALLADQMRIDSDIIQGDIVGCTRRIIAELNAPHRCRTKRLSLTQRVDAHSIQPGFGLSGATVDKDANLERMPNPAANRRGANGGLQPC